MDLKRDKRQNIQKKLDFPSEKGEARRAGREETESRQAVYEPESPASTIRLMEEVCERENLLEALRRVKANKGSAGIDGMTVGQLSGYLKEHWLTIREQLLNGTYPNYARPISSASGNAGPAATVEPNVLRSQLRFSTGTIRASSSNPSTTVPCGRLWLGDRSRLGEILLDGAGRETCRG